jgi:hypothetical protein
VKVVRQFNTTTQSIDFLPKVTPINVFDCNLINFNKYESYKLKSKGVVYLCADFDNLIIGGSAKIYNSEESDIQISLFQCNVDAGADCETDPIKIATAVNYIQYYFFHPLDIFELSDYNQPLKPYLTIQF